MYKTMFFCIFAGIMFFSCQKQSNPGGNSTLFLSADTIRFDTVFALVGAVTQQVKLINNNNAPLNISSIALAGGTNSPFTINIDGSPGPDASNLQIQSNDSIYIFITVLVKPGSVPTPFMLTDSIRISYNGINQYIQLTAWGQNAHFLKSQTISINTNWANDLPYVIYGNLTVDSNVTLTIQPGAHIYMHADGTMLINGTLKVMGEPADSQRVYFTGDRLDQPYASYPGSWPGIYFQPPSKDNQMNYAIIQNGFHTLVAEGPATDASPKLSLNECIINNSLDEGILGEQTSITAINCLISNCGENIVIALGGIYQFQYCTVASYSTNLLSHQLPVLTVSNAGANGNQIITSDLNASFTNCTFWGSQAVTDEALISKQGSSIFNVTFNHSILKQQDYPANIDSVVLILNADPLFISTGSPSNLFDFHLQSGSPALDQGTDLGIAIDLDGNPRPVNQPDIGCYERQ